MRPTGRRGYSLLETLIALMVGMLIAGSVVSLLISQIKLSATTNRNVLNQENLREVVKFMCDEIRLANTFDGSEPITVANTQALSFHADIDANDELDFIEYYLNGSTLMRRYTTIVGGAPFVAEDMLLQNVQTLTFTYFALDDAVPANIAEITSADVELRLDISADATDPTGGRLATQMMVGRATIRNKLL